MRKGEASASWSGAKLPVSSSLKPQQCSTGAWFVRLGLIDHVDGWLMSVALCREEYMCEECAFEFGVSSEKYNTQLVDMKEAIKKI